MTISTSPTLREYAPLSSRPKNYSSPGCILIWRQGQLLVRRSEKLRQPYMPALESEVLLVECLKHSPVRLVRLDPDLEEAKLKLWADACAQAQKTVFLQVPPAVGLPSQSSPLGWQLKRLVDRTGAAVLLLLLSPLMLTLALLIYSQTPGPILFRQWRVGERGRLFQVLKFRTMVVGADRLHHQVMGGQTGLHKREDDPRITPLGRWLRKYSLDELPQLFNVLRGEMSLVGPRPWALYDAVRISLPGRQRLNATPGMTGAWQVGARSTLLDLDAVNRCDLEYLYNWSLWRDLKILLLTIPKVLSGFGAY
ncbi:heterocyst development glycosyltransferase HepC [Leptolyngbya sp. FACHB-261]|uniref:heterocyst development glycosyltransferase HepC n=1 Tax=Leptolyngbya sp. FACHB-261 TaxID=2692806 RepID=UPI001682327F|nr:heterocyst development glycosyltransferase HepC [Leptolyngbya sp. FACHB-261]MBD2101139.1 sugar transferase [Leptolyngbya sp. FACHB-261]